MFDDGDERTLRRSSLCLKGERHFNESEVSTLQLNTLLYFKCRIDGMDAKIVMLVKINKVIHKINL